MTYNMLEVCDRLLTKERMFMAIQPGNRVFDPRMPDQQREGTVIDVRTNPACLMHFSGSLARRPGRHRGIGGN